MMRRHVFEINLIEFAEVKMLEDNNVEVFKLGVSKLKIRNRIAVKSAKVTRCVGAVGHAGQQPPTLKSVWGGGGGANYILTLFFCTSV